MLQCVAVLQCVAACFSVLQYVAACCSVLQCVAVCCSVLQCVAACCNVSQYNAKRSSRSRIASMQKRGGVKCVYGGGGTLNKFLKI